MRKHHLLHDISIYCIVNLLNMKKYFLLSLVFTFISCCENNNNLTYTMGATYSINGFTIITDTLTSTEENTIIVPELKYNDNYYCVSYSKDSLGEYRSGDFYIINTIGNSEKIAGVNGYMDFSYNDMHIRHDSIIIKSFYDAKENFYLDDKNKRCVPITTADDVIFEDGDFYVTALDFGEWGSAIWFRDKRTGIEYEASWIITPEVNKFKGAYYLVSPGEINIIENPKLLHNAGKDAYRSFLGKNSVEKFSSRSHGGKQTGMKTIFSRSIAYEREDNFFIGPSFIHDNNLCYIVSDSAQTYVAKVEDNKLMPLAIIASTMNTGRYTNQYRNLYLNKSIPFRARENKLHGLLEIKGDSIFVHYFKNLKP